MSEGKKIFEDVECHVVETADKLQEKLLANYKDLEMPGLEESSDSESDNLGMPDSDRAKKAGLEMTDKEELKAVCLARGQTFQLLEMGHFHF